MAEKKKPYHAKDSKVYHTNPNCTSGNDIETKNKRKGTGGKRPCKKCNPTKKKSK